MWPNPQVIVDLVTFTEVENFIFYAMTFIAGGEWDDGYQNVLIFIAQIYRLTTWDFAYDQKYVKAK